MKLFRCTTILFALLLLLAGNAGGEYITVQEVQVRGAGHLPRGVIFAGADIRQSGKNLMVNPDSIEQVLSQNPLVKNYSISGGDNRLVINIEENRSLFMAVVPTTRGNLFLEAGENFEIKGKGFPVSANLPIIYLEETDFDEEGLSAEVRNFAEILLRIRKNEPALYCEISELRIKQDYTELRARGRKPVFLIDSNYKGFMRFKYTLGYIDNSKREFSKADLRGNPVLLK